LSTATDAANPTTADNSIFYIAIGSGIGIGCFCLLLAIVIVCVVLRRRGGNSAKSTEAPSSAEMVSAKSVQYGSISLPTPTTSFRTHEYGSLSAATDGYDLVPPPPAGSERYDKF
jgi:hypothetical protein